MLTGELLRAARAMARLEQVQLAADAGVSLETIKRLERIHGVINANVRTIQALLHALDRRGIRVEYVDEQRGGVWRRDSHPASAVAPRQASATARHLDRD